MPDIREVIKALDTDDKANWLHHRTEMRRSFIQAHNTTVGIANWTEEDDAFLDLIDIKLALLFDRSGRMDQDKTIVEKSDGDTIVEDIMKEAAKIVPSDATKLMQGNVQVQAATNSWGATH